MALELIPVALFHFLAPASYHNSSVDTTSLADPGFWVIPFSGKSVVQIIGIKYFSYIRATSCSLYSRLSYPRTAERITELNLPFQTLISGFDVDTSSNASHFTSASIQYQHRKRSIDRTWYSKQTILTFPRIIIYILRYDQRI